MRLEEFKVPKRFDSDERGNIGIMFGVMLVPLVFMLGMAVDFARAYYARNLLQLASDQAALAASIPKNLTDTQRVQLALDSFKANSAASSLTNSVTPCVSIGTATNCSATGTASSSITVATTAQIGKITIAANANVPTYFLSILKNASVDIGAGGNAVVANNNIEIALMVGLPGSLGNTDPVTGQPKINHVKSSCNDFVSTLYPTGTNPKIRVAVAPTSDYVNAGPYAVTATGLPATGSYSKKENLCNTQGGKFNGTTSGVSKASGFGFGTTSSGATYSSTFCSSPTTTSTTIVQYTDTKGSNGTHDTGDKCTPGASGQKQGAFYYDDSHGTKHYVSDKLGDNGDNNNSTYKKYRTYHWTSDNKWEQDDNDSYNTYIPKTTTTTVTDPNCTTAADQTGPLITCVTERTGQHASDDEAPGGSGGYCGGYNKGAAANTVSNYSNLGKCWVAGQTLPQVVPLTSDTVALGDFCSNATVGGGHAEHIGAAWAYYAVSPKWSSVWPTTSKPADYTEITTKKHVVMVIDHEANEQYSSVDSKAQTKALCTSMKAQGITVHAIGYGLSSTSKASDGSSDGEAKDLIESCSSSMDTVHYASSGTELSTAMKTCAHSILNASNPSKLTQ